MAESHFLHSIVIYCPIFITNMAGISPPASVLTSVTSLKPGCSRISFLSRVYSMVYSIATPPRRSHLGRFSNMPA